MKVLFQVYDRTAYTGGPIVNMVRLLPRLQRLGVEVVAVVEFTDEHPNGDDLVKQGVPCVFYPLGRDSLTQISYFIDELERHQPDVFVSNVSASAGIAGHWAIRSGIPVIHTHRSDDALNNGMAEFFFAGPPAWRLSALVCVSSFLQQQIVQKAQGLIKTEVIPSGVPLTPYQSDQSNYGIFEVVFSGRHVQQQKRIFDVLAGFIALAKAHHDFNFTFIGHGDPSEMEEMVRRIQAEQLQERIRLAGRLQGEVYKAELASKHVIVLLSDYEGIPGSIMDGMSCGLVPVVFRIDGIEELVIHEHNGLIVNDRGKGLTDAILRLREDHALRLHLAKNALGTIKSQFSIEVAASRWMRLLEEVTMEFEKTEFIRPSKLELPKNDPRLLQYRRPLSFLERMMLKLSQKGRSVLRKLAT